jgi:hypothetical protein
MSVAWPAAGTTLGVDMATPPGGTYTLIPGIRSATGLGSGEMGERDTSTLASATKTYAPTLSDPGEVSIDLNGDPTDLVHQFLAALSDTPPAGFSNNYKATFATAETVSSVVFPAFVKTFDGWNAGSVDDNLEASVTLRRTGPQTRTP